MGYYSTMVICNDIVIVIFIVEYDRRKPGLPSAPLDLEDDDSSIDP